MPEHLPGQGRMSVGSKRVKDPTRGLPKADRKKVISRGAKHTITGTVKG